MRSLAARLLALVLAAEGAKAPVTPAAAGIALLGRREKCKGACSPPKGVQMPGAGYSFLGFGTEPEARAACKSHGGLPAPKTQSEQQALQAAVDSALHVGNLSQDWPRNTVWLGGQWNTSLARWEWEDGLPIGVHAAARTKLAQMAASSHLNQHLEPKLCMVLDGTWHDSLHSHAFGILCQGKATGAPSPEAPASTHAAATSAPAAATSVPPETVAPVTSAPADGKPTTTLATKLPPRVLLLTRHNAAISPNSSDHSSLPSPTAGNSTISAKRSDPSSADDGELDDSEEEAHTETDDGGDGCFEDESTWEPLDMPNVFFKTDVPNAGACQKYCQETPGCAHFSYWKWGKHCHLQDAFAIQQHYIIGFTSGPFKCSGVVSQKRAKEPAAANVNSGLLIAEAVPRGVEARGPGLPSSQLAVGALAAAAVGAAAVLIRRRAHDIRVPTAPSAPAASCGTAEANEDPLLHATLAE